MSSRLNHRPCVRRRALNHYATCSPLNGAEKARTPNKLKADFHLGSNGMCRCKEKRHAEEAFHSEKIVMV
ncbi:hypothetical protein KIN20_006712 [Parelaphostrongylus tenuis]|uniref:Uncharacterized protein n=1 Tax=Parelaphostrongylus tenuis TaxID=148309 RepID=A0AAD5MMY9_PARTN|nr:hypothetical protein KIN20_006712 [Parelaphostrongylus tenuis]